MDKYKISKWTGREYNPITNRSKDTDILCDKAILLLREGKSVHSIAKILNTSARNLGGAMFLRFPKEYGLLVYGEVIDCINGINIHKIPNSHTTRTEAYCVKAVKREYISKGYIEEVGVWIKGSRIVVDLYNPLTKHSIEIQNKLSNGKVLIKRLDIYKHYFNSVSCIIIGNHPMVEQRLKNEGFDCWSITKLPSSDLIISYGT